MKIYIATDHAGFELKEALAKYLADDLKHEVVDLGAETLDDADDYPDFIARAAKEVSRDPEHVKAIVLGGSGEGEAMVANRFPNVRAAVYYGGTLDIVRLSREHNDANILSLGARLLSVDEAKRAVKLWLETQFSGDERHVRRIKKINNLTS